MDAREREIRESFRRRFGYEPEHLWDRFFDRQGEEISFDQWSELRGRGAEYRLIGRDELDDGRVVSTVWLGQHYAEFDADDEAGPLIFETMLFSPELRSIEYDWHWRTEEDAQAGHERIVRHLRAGWEASHAANWSLAEVAEELGIDLDRGSEEGNDELA